MKEKCMADDKGICNLGIANKCIYGINEPYCIITNFTNFLLIKILLKEKK